MLTDDEITEIERASNGNSLAFAHAIESAVLTEKSQRSMMVSVNLFIVFLAASFFIEFTVLPDLMEDMPEWTIYGVLIVVTSFLWVVCFKFIK